MPHFTSGSVVIIVHFRDVHTVSSESHPLMKQCYYTAQCHLKKRKSEKRRKTSLLLLLLFKAWWCYIIKNKVYVCISPKLVVHLIFNDYWHHNQCKMADSEKWKTLTVTLWDFFFFLIIKKCIIMCKFYQVNLKQEKHCFLRLNGIPILSNWPKLQKWGKNWTWTSWS